MLKASLLAGGGDALDPLRARSTRPGGASTGKCCWRLRPRFRLGTALETTGAASEIAERMIALAGGNPWITLAIIYVVTLIVTELITNNAAAALMFPFALATANGLDVSYMPFMIA